ncbi:hypothetical protein B0H19DRAFT_1257752 [Mycena capillaripes]|nr:hypothetical protein B0H19DRAFT_1257752 [Mycena capillaripes]
MATSIDVAAIKKVADHLATREEFILEKQQWRDNEDRLRGFKVMRDARAKWIEAATKTHESIEAAKKEGENGKAKLTVLNSLVAALQPSNIEPIKNTKLRFEYISEVFDSTQGLLDVVAAGQAAGIATKVQEALRAAEDLQDVLLELKFSRARLVNNWVRATNQGKEAGYAYKGALKAVVEELYPDMVGKKLGVQETVSSLIPLSHLQPHSTGMIQAMVQARLIEKAGRSTTLTKLVKGIKDGATVRTVLIGLILVVVDTIDSALDNQPTAAITSAITGVVGLAAGTVVGIAVDEFVASSLGAFGAVTCGVLGAAAGALAGFVVGVVVGMVMEALIDLICGAFEVSERKYWDQYMKTPIVYRVFVKE